MLRVTLDGQPWEFESGTTILTALTRANLHVPHLCHDDRLAPAAVCRLCSVEVNGQPKPVSACSTLLEDGMAIRTRTEGLEARRRDTLRLLAWSHPAEARRADPPSAFVQELRAYGLEDELRPSDDAQPVDDSHPYLRHDPNLCIECYRCVRICDQVQGQFVWRVVGRGHHSEIVPGTAASLAESACVSCGACADTCPTGAISDKQALESGPAERWTRTTCPYCGVGCELEVGSRGEQLVQVRPAPDSPVNKGHLCVKGRFAFRFVGAEDRITTPMIRGPQGWREVSWQEAIRFTAERLTELRREHGPDAAAVLGSSRATNEENYVTQKFARVVLGTNNVDSCARVCHGPTAAALGAVLGTGAATNSFADLERAGCFLVFGANPTENHPIVGARVKQAVLRGAKLIVVDPRRTELAQLATVHLQLRPGTNVPLLHALAFTLLDEDLVDRDFLATRVEGLEDFQRRVAEWPPERAAVECGVDAALIRQAARLYAGSGPSMCIHGLGITEHHQGTLAVELLTNLALLTGNLGIEGAGMNPLRGQNNVQGAAHMGCEPSRLTGYSKIEAVRPLFERIWRAQVPSNPGIDAVEVVDAALEGGLKALYAIGYDVLLSHPDANRTRRALARLDLLIVQDLFLTETAREFGTVFFPAASSFEKDGTFMNSERRVQRVRKVVEPPGQARSDWEILDALAAELGHRDAFAFQSAEEIWNEVRKVWPAGAGISYARIARQGLQWPCPSEDHPGTPILHVDGFASAPRAPLTWAEYRRSDEVADAEYPLTLVTGRMLFHFNAGTMTGRTDNVKLRAPTTLDLSPADARRLGIADGERVRLKSRHGEAEIQARLDEGLREGELFATFHAVKVFLNHVVGGGRDAATHTPEYKVTAVRVEKLPAQNS